MPERTVAHGHTEQLARATEDYTVTGELTAYFEIAIEALDAEDAANKARAILNQQIESWTTKPKIKITNSVKYGKTE